MSRSSFPGHPGPQQKGNAQLLLLLLGAVLSFYFAYYGIVRPHTAHHLGPAVHGSSSRHSGTGTRQQQQAYRAEAIANLTRYRSAVLSKMVPHMKLNGTLPGYGLNAQDWQLFKPVISCPPQRPLTHYGGDGDGSKLLCSLSTHGALRKDCVIYSMGSRGDFKFEQDMLKQTSCSIHTFDCTYNGSSIGPRHTYHKWCVASANTVAAKGPTYRTWSNITLSLGHKHVDLLKIDIDGYEYEVAGEWEPENTVLPNEIGMEVHIMVKAKPSARPWLKTWLGQLPRNVAHTVPALGLFFLHLANLGYGIYSQDTNTGAPECCSEFSLLRIPGADSSWY